MNTVSDDVLKEITQIIVGGVHPLMVILFGSQVRGSAGKGSDLDFLIIEDESFDASRSRRKEIGNIHRLLREIRMPIDILVYSKDEFDRWANSRNHIVARAIKEGRILYEWP